MTPAAPHAFADVEELLSVVKELSPAGRWERAAARLLTVPQWFSRGSFSAGLP
ncbi:hypothetical protein [Streptomyces puniciscabiei]|uniref:hypothetical protein n=1 Tax=Streptomyces puniciscabiei TaxID=164348 RepID=UPI003322E5E9